MSPNETAVALRPEAGLPAELTGISTGYEGIDASELVIPRMKIVQPTSRVGTPGTFRMNLTNEEFKTLDVVVIRAERGRIEWPDGSDPDALPVCKSFDFMNPDPAIESPISPKCAEYQTRGGRQVLVRLCPHSIWGPNGERPQCDEQYNLLCILAGEMLPFWVTFGGNSISAVKSYISAIALRRKSLYQFKTVFKLVEKTQPNRHHHLDNCVPVALSAEELQLYAPAIIQLKDVTFKRTAEAEESTPATSSAPPTAGAPSSAGPAAPQEGLPEWMKE